MIANSNRRVFRTGAGVMLLTWAAAAYGQPTDPPAAWDDPPPTEARGHDAGPGPPRPGRPPEAVGRSRPLSPEEVDAALPRALAFARQYSPMRLQAMVRLGGDPELPPPRVRDALVRRFLDLERVREADAVLYDLRVRQIKTEDMIFHAIALRKELDTSRTLWDMLRELTLLNFAEREHRLTRLEARVAAERARLQQDRANVDAVVADRANEINRDGFAAIARRGWWFDPDRKPPGGRAGARAGTGRPVPDEPTRTAGDRSATRPAGE